MKKYSTMITKDYIPDCGVEDGIEVEEEKTPLDLLEEWYQDDSDRDGLWEGFEKILDIFRGRGIKYET